MMTGLIFSLTFVILASHDALSATLPPNIKPLLEITGDKYVNEGDTILLTCKGTHKYYPPLDIDWYLSGNAISTRPEQGISIRTNVSLIEKTIVSSMEIKQAKMSDKGRYVCRTSDMEVTSFYVHILKRDDSEHPKPNTEKNSFVGNASESSRMDKYNPMFNQTEVYSTKFIYKDLVNYVLDNSSPDLIPITQDKKPINVTIALSIFDILTNENERNQVEINGWLQINWNSSVLFDPKLHNGFDQVRVPASEVWKPDIALYNGKMILNEDQEIIDRMVFFSSGYVIWGPKSRMIIPCDLSSESNNNITCSAKLGSWTFSGDQLDLNVGNDPVVDVSEFQTDASEYEIYSASVERHETQYPCCEEKYIEVVFTINFGRKNSTII